MAENSKIQWTTGGEAMTTTSEQYALLRAIVLNPSDDLPRQVYADWLEERGQQVWAQFIRDCCELSSTRRGTKKHKQLLDSVQLIKNDGSLPWFLPKRQGVWRRDYWTDDRDYTAAYEFVAKSYKGMTISIVTLRKGLIESIACNRSQWKSSRSTVLQWHPLTWVNFREGRYYRRGVNNRLRSHWNIDKVPL